MALEISALTGQDPTGTGVFDILMVSIKAHLIEEFKSERINGKEYATVYLGAMQSSLDRALEFLLQKDKAEREAPLLAAQIAKLEKEGELIDAQIETAEQQRLLIIAQTALATQQKENLELEAELIPEQKLKLIAETALITQNTANAVTENTVLVAQECKLRAEYDVLIQTELKTIAETAVLNQKKITEQAQTSSSAVDPDSVIGKQCTLYQRQADGFLRDAEQKAAQIMASTWNTRRTTDEGTVADGTNQLSDASIGEVMTKLKAGIAA